MSCQFRMFCTSEIHRSAAHLRDFLERGSLTGAPVAATYKPPMLVPRARLAAGASARRKLLHARDFVDLKPR